MVHHHKKKIDSQAPVVLYLCKKILLVYVLENELFIINFSVCFVFSIYYYFCLFYFFV